MVLTAGIAIYGQEQKGRKTDHVQSEGGREDYAALQNDLAAALETDLSITPNDTHAVIDVAADRRLNLRTILFPTSRYRVMSQGDSIEIYKEVGLPGAVSERFHVSAMSGSHGIGHTRMATESAVTTDGAHPYSTGPDQCLVHNGSLSNHNALRRKLTRTVSKSKAKMIRKSGCLSHWKCRKATVLVRHWKVLLKIWMVFLPLSWVPKMGLECCAILSPANPRSWLETDQYVAFGSEYRALVNLPGIEDARVWEPEPATVYFWRH